MNPVMPVISNILAIQDKAELYLYLAIFKLHCNLRLYEHYLGTEVKKIHIL